MDFDDLMDNTECVCCGDNGWRCRCTLREIEEAEAVIEETCKWTYVSNKRRAQGCGTQTR